MRHFLNTQDFSLPEIQQMIDRAMQFKEHPLQPLLAGRTIALVFFNPSLRTRTSFEVGAWQLGAHAIVLQPGKDAWPIAIDVGAVMDGEAEEHVCEAARVLSRYCDLIAVRAFPKFENWQIDRQDRMLRAFAQYSTVPVINMETITHPCQELAHIMALQQRLGSLQGRKYVLTWVWHPRPLNTAVANSAAMIATRFGMHVTLLCPNEQYVLDDRYMQCAVNNAAAAGSSFEVSHDIASAYDNADVVYSKSWGALPYFGNWDAEKPIRDQYKHFIVDDAKMARTNGALFSHCLPMRRNVKATDSVVDSPSSLVIEEAENRLHVQKAMMCQLLPQSSSPSVPTSSHTAKEPADALAH